ncbi:MAG: hypothetical protein DSY77_08515 [Bacteroidetes bacterium]|jgi:hypothetical protein|nr:MAG: hypothetical protein DSY77_08515 [Bacteroidota bacterium]
MYSVYYKIYSKLKVKEFFVFTIVLQIETYPKLKNPQPNLIEGILNHKQLKFTVLKMLAIPTL